MFRNALTADCALLAIVSFVQAAGLTSSDVGDAGIDTPRPVKPGSALDSSISLQADFFATVGTADGTEFPDTGVVEGTNPPVITPVNLGEIESTTPIMANLILIGAPTVWSNLMSVDGSPAIPATVTPGGAFTWDPTGSARGPKGNGVFYSWSATFTSPGGSTTGIAMMLSLIPEPTTLVLSATMAMCLGIAPLCRRSLANRGVN